MSYGKDKILMDGTYLGGGVFELFKIRASPMNMWIVKINLTYKQYR